MCQVISTFKSRISSRVLNQIANSKTYIRNFWVYTNYNFYPTTIIQHNQTLSVLNSPIQNFRRPPRTPIIPYPPQLPKKLIGENKNNPLLLLANSKLIRLSKNGIRLVFALDEVNTEVPPSRETMTSWRVYISREFGTVDVPCKNDILAQHRAVLQTRARKRS